MSAEWTYELLRTDNGILETGGGLVMTQDGSGKPYPYAVKARREMSDGGDYIVMGWGHTPEAAHSEARRLALQERA